MDSKKLIWLGLFLGSAIGGYLPILWGGGLLSFTSIILSALGGIVGIWVGFKVSRY
jgi:hypothetical protein